MIHNSNSSTGGFSGGSKAVGFDLFPVNRPSPCFSPASALLLPLRPKFFVC